MDTLVAYRYIDSVPGVQGGEPCIKGTRTPVRSIVQNWRLGNSPEEIVAALPHLTLAQVHEAMSYYYDHQSEIEALIEKHRIPEELLWVNRQKLG
ncbi:MAG: DUF433 domain-containing protein [Pyrinomonadaceae bacterium]